MSLTLNEAMLGMEQYRGNDHIVSQLGETAMIAIVGPVATGKNFLMSQTGIHVVGTETSRAPRPSDAEANYRYSSEQKLLEAIEAKEVVQYGVYPPHIYASRLQDYRLGEPNISDIWANAVSALRNKGFQSVKHISVLTPKDQWYTQLRMRLENMSVEHAVHRLDESRYSIKRTLAETAMSSQNHLTIINAVENTQDNVEKIIEFANGKHVDGPEPDLIIHTAQAMNKVIDRMYSSVE